MNKKEELKKLLKEREKDEGFFDSIIKKSHVRMVLILSPAFLISVLIDWIYNLGWFTNPDIPTNLFRIISIVASILIPLLIWMQYDTRVMEEKKETEKIEKLIDDFKE